MNVLMHYTTQRHVFDLFSRVGMYEFTVRSRIESVSDFYKRFNRTQDHLYFIVSYFDFNSNTTKYTVSSISFDENQNVYGYSSVSENIKEVICSELGLDASSTYDHESYYRVFRIDGNEKEFVNNNIESDLNKIKMRFFTWDELFESNKILFDEINNKIFSKENVLKVASTYTPKIKYSDEQKKLKYFDALKSVGFISDAGINISSTTLHGDIGEFLMHTMLSQFLSEQSTEQYIYPKLAFKTSPKMPVYGNDGTIYLKDKNEIYYLEAKFYGKLNDAINMAVTSLSDHNGLSQEGLNHKIELFRNIKTDELFEIIEIDGEVKENLVLFLICDNFSEYGDILDVVRKNTKLNNFKNNFNVILFVLPIINKREFLELFSERSNGVWEELNA